MNASFINNLDRRSDKGYIFKLFSGAVDWVVQKQQIVSTLTIKIELLALLYTDKQAVW